VCRCRITKMYCLNSLRHTECAYYTKVAFVAR
jgi:hypothetical protein